MRILLPLFIFISFNLNAQQVSEQELIGEWKPVKLVEIKGEIPNEMKEQINVMQNAFLKTIFVFRNENKFTFDFPFEEMRLTNGYWKLDSQTGNISIYEEENEKSYFMGITASKKDGKMIFMMEETYFAFEVKKE
ncbi:hypothetical protein [Fulvivirga sp.]|uniref:hypothetical protein n=1 Tax=Fulvivirga sp. TaxID=1931237 RepID=UPI0032ECE923